MMFYKIKSPKIALLAVACGLALPFSASAVEFSANFNGYLRAGTGQTTEGDTQQCFKLNGAETKYRLGNECETLTELDINQDIAELADGSIISAEVMGIFKNNYGHKMTFSKSDGHGASQLAQAYVRLRNIPWLNDGGLWAGRRYYKRHDVHISDFFYWNPQGTGIGIEDVGIGDGPLKLSYFFSRQDNADQRDNIGLVSKHDLRMEGIPANPGGSLAVGVNYYQTTDNAPGGDAGWALNIEHQQQEFLGGHNVIALQYGKASGINMAGTADPALTKDNNRFRLVEAYDWQFGAFGGQATAVFQRTKAPGAPNQEWISLGVRPVYALSNEFKVMLELGRDQVDDGLGNKPELTKTTLAAAWSPNGPKWNQRPEFRVYYTHAEWNKDAQAAATAGDALSTTGSFGTARHGGNVGVQVEYWW